MERGQRNFHGARGPSGLGRDCIGPREYYSARALCPRLDERERDVAASVADIENGSWSGRNWHSNPRPITAQPRWRRWGLSATPRRRGEGRFLPRWSGQGRSVDHPERLSPGGPRHSPRYTAGGNNKRCAVSFRVLDTLFCRVARAGLLNDFLIFQQKADSAPLA
jgi:hypothetical protein